MRRELPAGFAVLVVATCAALLALVGSASAEPPVVVMDSATNPTYTTVEVSGKVNAEGGFTLWLFEVSDDGGTTWHSTSGQNVEGGSEASAFESVSGVIEGLRAGTTYEVRLIANNFSDPIVSSTELEFTTESIPAPTVTIDPVSTMTGTTAELSGTITANSLPGDPALSDVNWHFVCSPQCVTSNQGTVAAGQSEPVQATATNLEPNTEYTVTLVGENAGPSVSAGPVSFKTSVIAPAAETLSANIFIGGTAAKLRGEVDPNNSPADYWFEYGQTTAYGQIAPAHHADAGSGRGHVVSEEIDGLTPGTTYHYRLVAEGPGGPSVGGDVAFTTGPPSDQGCPNETIRRQQYTTRLPECRAYELVSPVQKEGGTIGIGAGRGYNVFFGLRASVDGNATLFTTTTAQAGATSSHWLYKATRSADGWSSEQVALPALGGLGMLTAPLTNVSADLSTGLFRNSAALSAGEVFTGTEKILLHALEPGGFTTWLNPGQAPGVEGAVPRGQTKDLSHALFTSNTALTDDAPSGASSSLYDYTAGGLHLVSILPDDQPDPVGAQLGTNVSIYGGDHARFNAVSEDGSHIVFTALSDSQVYQRIDGTTTVEVSASQGGTDPTGAFPAQFVAATTSGSKVFFISAAELTPDANTGGHTGKDLYEYDVASGDLTDLTVDEVPGDPAGANVLGLAGLADDGSVLYVVAEGVLAPGGSTADTERASLYAVHPGGATDFVASLRPGSLGTGDSVIWEGGASGGSGEGLIPSAQVTPSGRYLAFATSAGKLTPDSVAGYNVYLYDAKANSGPRLTCVSCGPGDPVGGGPQLNGTNLSNLETYQPRFVFDNGRVFFATRAALVEEDTNGRLDVYEYHDGSLSLLSSGRGNAKAEFADASAGGQNVLIVTASRLVRSDIDEVDDVYDVRVDGGFSEPQRPPSCEGEGCRASTSTPPPSTTPASAAELRGRRGSTNGKALFSVDKVSAKAARIAAKTGRMILRVETSTGGTLRVTATARLGKQPRQIAQARKSVARASKTSLALRLSTAARRRLADSGRLKVALRVSFSKASKPLLRSVTLVAAKHDRKGR
jgi:hypothetical protein